MLDEKCGSEFAGDKESNYRSVSPRGDLHHADQAGSDTEPDRDGGACSVHHLDRCSGIVVVV